MNRYTINRVSWVLYTIEYVNIGHFVTLILLKVFLHFHVIGKSDRISQKSNLQGVGD